MLSSKYVLNVSPIYFVENPVISSGNYSTLVFSQESLLLNCSATSYDQLHWFHLPSGKTDVEPFQFTWCKDDTCTLYDDPRMLIIRKVSMELSFSKFICVASCSATGKNASAYVFVIVQSKLRILLTSFKIYHLKELASV